MVTDLAGKKIEIYDNWSVLIPGLIDLIDLGKHYKYYSVIESKQNNVFFLCSFLYQFWASYLYHTLSQVCE